MLRLIIENTKIALSAIRGQLLRTILTVFIIASGIWALVGILSAVNALEYSLMSNFTSMGANTFNINRFDQSMEWDARNTKINPVISYQQAVAYQQDLDLPYAQTSISFTAAANIEVKSDNRKTDPEATVLGVDDFYFENSGLELEKGRVFNSFDILNNSSTCVLGSDFAKGLFKDIDPIGQTISVRGKRFEVIGLLKEKGSLFGNNQDFRVFIPIQIARGLYSQPNINYQIKTLVKNPEMLNSSIDQATLAMRKIRSLSPSQENNFGISRSDDLINSLRTQTMTLTIIAWVIGVITIFGSSIALMNIMLVSVTERTKEIGIRKSLGATKNTIRWQFFTETLIISQLGGLLGMLLGILTGYVFTQFAGFAFVVPWGAIIAAVITCFIVAIVSGLYPAIKASKLDPVEALRYE